MNEALYKKLNDILYNKEMTDKEIISRLKIFVFSNGELGGNQK